MPAKKKHTKPKYNRKDYTWDIFISYSHDPNVYSWVHEYFSPQLVSWIKNDIKLNPTIRVFKDRPDIKTGDDWKIKLGKALTESVCLIPILTAEYFRSRWCRAEWNAFLKKEKDLGWPSHEHPGGLIFPIKFSDGNHFSKSANSKQIFDMSAWAYPYPAFRDSPAYLDFIKGIQTFIKDLTGPNGVLAKPPAQTKLNISLARKERPKPRNMRRVKYR